MDKAMAKYIFPTLLTAVCMSQLSGCVTQSFENNEPIVKTQANRDEMAATRVSLGLGYLGMGDMSQAKLNLEKAKRFSPNLVQVHTAFAHYYETVGEGKLATESFEQALAIKADSADTLNNYGVFLCRQGNIAAAEVQFLKAIAVPSYLLVSQSYENLASCYLQNDNFEKAEMYLGKAISHSPNRTVTLFQMVRLQYAMADYKAGKKFLQKFERNTQRFTADSLALSYKLYWKLGQRRTASNYANMLVKMYPQSWEAKQYLLNELELIDADNLAKKYQLAQKEKNRHLSPSSNKRVVKLSPKKSTGSAYTRSKNTVSSPAITAKSAPTNTALIATAVPPISSTATQPILGASATMLSATVAGVAAVKSTGTSATVAGSAAAKSTGTSATVAGTAAAKSTGTSATVAGTAAEKLTGTSATVAETAAEKSTGASATVAETTAAKSTGTSATAIVAETAATKSTGTSATVTETATTKSTVASPSNMVVNNPTVAKAPVEKTAEIVLPAIVAEQVTQSGATKIETAATKATTVEPTSTQPIAATRDVPLPEALPEPVEIEVVVPEKAKNAETTNTQETFHTVKAGENLYSISMKYNVKLSALRKWNDISEKNKIRIGKKLYVSAPQTVNKIND